ncbi:SDR family oxidoreductase [Marininema halotolerans]|uniref:Short chain dehydrogenase n=1 Tax=Marininema halotolerans TaxID=1155944 RepID=A0A1I6S3C1_9BACL|nr:SDR family oxidoreductase [Marininema halotolerans]SFS71465.1 short chain dehydrogenase [Marininema halotolerans]
MTRLESENKRYPCYVCKQPLTIPHPHYSKLCPSCGDLNEKKRIGRHDLHQYTSLVTGGRTKIGYFTALRLLRDGARVIITTRFPYDALQQYIQEHDYETWKDRIHIFGLDFRYIDQVEQFAYLLDQSFSHIDIIINNAAQTVRMPEEEYHTLLLNESNLKTQLFSPALLQLSSGEKQEFTSTPHISEKFMPLQLINQEVEVPKKHLADYNSWIAKSQDISLMEMLEVQLINVTAPFLLNSRLKNSMLRSPNRNRFIINVTSVEGKFNVKRKGKNHVHTNMSKASLNMMTLTMAKEYKKHQIFISSVDPGWVSSLFPEKLQGQNSVQLPLDFHDAAARICDPIYEGKDIERPTTGVYFKDYKQVDW